MTKQTAIEYLETDISRIGNTPQNLDHKESLQMGIRALEAWGQISEQLQLERAKHDSDTDEYDLGIQIGILTAMDIVGEHLLRIQECK